MSVPNGWTEVTNGEWGVGQPRFPENVPLGAHYVNEQNARGVLTPDGEFLIEGIASEDPNRGKPDGQWWAYVDGEQDHPTNFEPWIDPPVAPPAAPEPPASIPEPVAPVEPTAVPKVSVTLTDQGWLVRAEHRTGEIVQSLWADLRHAMLDAERWVRAHV